MALVADLEVEHHDEAVPHTLRSVQRQVPVSLVAVGTYLHGAHFAGVSLSYPTYQLMPARLLTSRRRLTYTSEVALISLNGLEMIVAATVDQEAAAALHSL